MNRGFTTGEGHVGRRPRKLNCYNSFAEYLGGELYEWRTFRGLSQQGLADRLHCDRSLISLAESGRHLLSEDMLAACDIVLETGGALSRLRPWAAGDFPPPPHTRSSLGDGASAPPSAGEEGDDDMKRRTILRAALGASAVLSPPVLELLAAQQARAESAITTAAGRDALIGHWEETVWRYGCGYGGRAPVAVLHDALLDLEDLHQFLAKLEDDDDRTRVLRVSAQMSGIIALVLGDMGHPRDAHRWYANAAAAAQASKDTAVQAWVTAREAMVPLNWGQPAAALRLADRARNLAGEGISAAGALAAAAQARAHAALGHTQEARKAIADAEHARERLRDTGATWYGYPVQQHLVHASRTYTAIGDTGPADRMQAEALRLISPTSVMSPALIHLDEALCTAAKGDHDSACTQAVHIITTLPPSYRTGLIARRGQELVGGLPHGAREITAARDLREILSSAQPPQLST
ncbi:hypothetical protein CTZ27_31370 [Streptomyces griseocarneus]|nr:hypothetical protein CTZ27_31370 [Streptomyces griseocarneus]